MKKLIILVCVVMAVVMATCIAFAEQHFTKEEKEFFVLVMKASQDEKKGEANGFFMDLIENSLKKGVDPNIQYQHGTTPLHLTACFGGVAVTRLLLRYGADPNIKSDEGASAYDIAKRYKHEKIAKILRGHGAKKQFVNWRSTAGWMGDTPLVTDKGFLVTWGGEAFEFRTTNGDPPQKDFKNLEWKIRITWTSKRSDYYCGQIIIKNGAEVKDLKKRSLALRKCK